MRFIARLISVLGCLLAAGFVVFVATLPKPDSVDLAAALEGISREETGVVALTGYGGVRIERAIGLFEQGIGNRVLISGTHPDTRKSDLTTTGSAEILECCVDLGPRARTTIGNAIETSDWAAARGYRAIVVVTSDFHLRRACMELEIATDEVVIVGVPVESNLEGWYMRRDGWRLMAGEYLKFMVTAARSLRP